MSIDIAFENMKVLRTLVPHQRTCVTVDADAQTQTITLDQRWFQGVRRSMSDGCSREDLRQAIEWTIDTLLEQERDIDTALVATILKHLQTVLSTTYPDFAPMHDSLAELLHGTTLVADLQRQLANNEDSILLSSSSSLEEASQPPPRIVPSQPPSLVVSLEEEEEVSSPVPSKTVSLEESESEKFVVVGEGDGVCAQKSVEKPRKRKKRSRKRMGGGGGGGKIRRRRKTKKPAVAAVVDNDVAQCSALCGGRGRGGGRGGLCVIV